MATKEAPKFPWTEPNGHYATYDLHCHCGTVRYTMKLSPPLYASDTTVEHPEQAVAIDCTCSYCARNGYLSVHPFAKDVEFTHGLENRVEYMFATEQCAQWFCRKCGSAVGTDLSKLMARLGIEERCGVNVRMLKDFDAEKLKVTRNEMARHLPPKYEDVIDELYAKR
ncbi:hypothetical protein LTR85_007123 [Meristemomyces frigidus]|nr:hypothetical protein LTR85_007123 [Meristemomyces frigidus]